MEELYLIPSIMQYSKLEIFLKDGCFFQFLSRELRNTFYYCRLFFNNIVQ